MKKLYVLIVMVLLSGYIFAQNLNQFGKNKKKNSINKLTHLKTSKINLISDKGSPVGYRWYNYASTMQNKKFPIGYNLNEFSDFLWPDTTVWIGYSNGHFTPYFHSVAVVLDPYDTIFNNSSSAVNMKQTKINGNYYRYYNYTIDSVEFPYTYIRNIKDASIRDTLEVEFITNLWDTYSNITGQMTAWGYDTTHFCGLFTDTLLNFSFSQMNPPLPVPSVQKVKILLGPEDSSEVVNGYITIKTKTIAPSTPLGYGNYLCAATFRFIPGFKWTPYKDTINAINPTQALNYLNFWAYEENDTSETVYPRYDPHFYNQSEFFTNESLDPKGVWLDQYIPRLWYDMGWGLDNIIAGFKIKVENLSITQNTEKNISLSQNIPNPAANSTIIPYQLASNNNVTIVITDITGNKIMEFNEGIQMAGNHTLELNTANLSSGMYLYTLNADNTNLTRKMIINK